MVIQGVSKRSIALVVVVLTILVPSLPVGAAGPGGGGGGGGPPYHVEAQDNGRIGCSAAYGPLRGADVCTRFDVGAQGSFDFPLDARLTSLVVRLEAPAGVLVEPEFALALFRPVGIEPVDVHGPAPLFGTWHFDSDNAWPGWEEPGQTLSVDVRLDWTTTLPQAAVMQEIHVCAGFFYNGAPVPDGYVPCAAA